MSIDRSESKQSVAYSPNSPKWMCAESNQKLLSNSAKIQCSFAASGWKRATERERERGGTRVDKSHNHTSTHTKRTNKRTHECWMGIKYELNWLTHDAMSSHCQLLQNNHNFYSTINNNCHKHTFDFVAFPTSRLCLSHTFASIEPKSDFSLHLFSISVDSKRFSGLSLDGISFVFFFSHLRNCSFSILRHGDKASSSPIGVDEEEERQSQRMRCVRNRHIKSHVICSLKCLTNLQVSFSLFTMCFPIYSFSFFSFILP